MIQPRCHPAAVFFNGKIMVFGGTDNKIYLQSSEYFDQETNEWEKLQIGPIKQYTNIQAVADDKNVYLISYYRKT